MTTPPSYRKGAREIRIRVRSGALRDRDAHRGDVGRQTQVVVHRVGESDNGPHGRAGGAEVGHSTGPIRDDRAAGGRAYDDDAAADDRAVDVSIVRNQIDGDRVAAGDRSRVVHGNGRLLDGNRNRSRTRGVGGIIINDV